MHCLLICLVLGADTGKHADCVEDRVDLIELNHFYDDEGRHVFDQLVFYDWDGWSNRYQVRDWRLLKGTSAFPSFNYSTDDYNVHMMDGDYFRHIVAPKLKETWTQHDVELAEREYLPKESRRLLSVQCPKGSSGELAGN